MTKQTRYIGKPLSEQEYAVLPKEQPRKEYPSTPSPETEAMYARLRASCTKTTSWNKLPLIGSVQDIIEAVNSHAKGIKALYIQGATFELQIVPHPFPYLLLNVRPALPEFHKLYKRILTLNTMLDGHAITLEMGTNGYPICASYRGEDYLVTELVSGAISNRHIHINASVKPYVLRLSNMVKRDVDTTYLVAAKAGRDLYGASLQTLTQGKYISLTEAL